MPGSIYILPADYTAFGLPSGTTADQIARAGDLVDAVLARQEGCIIVNDGTYSPGWMQKLDPAFTLELAAPIEPGEVVTATFTQATSFYLRMVESSDVLVFDRATSGSGSDISEAIEVAAPAQQGGPLQLKLRNVQFAHAAGALADGGMVIKQMKSMPQGRPLTRVSLFPLLRVLGADGRYGYGRRSNSNAYALQEFNLLSTLQQFGGPPIWEPIRINHIGVQQDGQIWVPAGILLAYFTECRFRYVAGWTYANLPDPIKRAVAALVRNSAAMACIPATLKSYKAGDTAIARFAATNMDQDTRDALMPYAARPFV